MRDYTSIERRGLASYATRHGKGWKAKLKAAINGSGDSLEDVPHYFVKEPYKGELLRDLPTYTLRKADKIAGAFMVAIEDYISGKGAYRHGQMVRDAHLADEFLLPTRAGILTISPHEDSIMCRFSDDPYLGHLAAGGSTRDPYITGKHNFHYGSGHDMTDFETWHNFRVFIERLCDYQPTLEHIAEAAKLREANRRRWATPANVA